MPSVTAKPSEVAGLRRRWGCRLQRWPSDHWIVVHLRTALEQAALEQHGAIDAQTAHLVHYACECEAGLRRVGRMILAGGMSARDALDAERLRAYLLRERCSAVQRLLSRRTAGPDAGPDDALAAILAGADTDCGNQPPDPEPSP